MREKRRDNRNRILHIGQSQRPDGRYAYKYKDMNGDVKFVAALSKSWFIKEYRSNGKSVIRLPRHYLN